MRQARRSNPQRDLVLIGDNSNRNSALASGWTHHNYNDFRSSKRDEFNSRFRWVQGASHDPVRRGKDWLRYVSERFFVIEEFIRRASVDFVWHFDSDTMILHELERYEKIIVDSLLDCTTLCQDSCPSGMLSARVVADFCSSMIEDYNDEEFISSQQNEFEKVNPGYAFTEMRAFVRYRMKAPVRTRHLASLFSSDRIWFDDCICCQAYGFKMSWAERAQQALKDFVAQDEEIVCRIGDTSFRFATVNCSWVPMDVYQWIEHVASGNGSSTSRRLVDSLAFTPVQRFRHKTRIALNMGRKAVYALKLRKL